MQYDPFSYEVQADPYPVYRWLRDEAPLWRNDELGFWTLSRHADVAAGTLDPARFSSARGTTLEFQMAQPMLINMDPPDHTTMRKMVNRVFTPRRISTLAEYIRKITRGFIAEGVAAGRLNVVEDLSAKVPIQVIGELLGIREENRDPLRLASARLIHREPDQRAVNEDNLAAAMEIAEMMATEVDLRRHQVRDDLIGALVNAEIGETGQYLSDEQVIGFCFLIGIAGNETVTKLVANAVVALEEFPDERSRLLADRSLMPLAVEETLRWEAPSQYQGRTVMEDTHLYGTRVPAGDFILLMTGAAGRDEREYEDPDTFRIGRQDSRPLGLGYGAHFCLGAALARLETKIMLEELLDVAPDYVLDRNGLERAHSTNVRGLTSLPVSFAPNPSLAEATQ